MQAEPRVTLTVRVSPELYGRVSAAAVGGLSMNAFVVRALEQALGSETAAATAGSRASQSVINRSASVRAPAEKGPGATPAPSSAPSRPVSDVARTWAR